ncbi:MAG: DUF4142 domain-containing protein [Pirellulaceae bacterium]
MRKVTGWMMASALVVGVGGSVFGQTERPREGAAGAQPRAGAAAGQREGSAASRPGQNAQSSQSDQQIAAVLLACCKNEVELAKFAQQKATSEEVKQFAEMLVKDHMPMCKKLEQAAGSLAAARPGAEGEAPAAGAERRDPSARPGARPGADASARGGQGGELNWVNIHQEIAQKCLASTKKALSQKEGQEFDQCYLSAALMSHQQAIDTTQVLQQHASSQLKSDLQQGIQMSTAHLEQGKQIMEKLEGGSPRLSARPESATPETRRPANPETRRPE